jgi:hypothetical protein
MQDEHKVFEALARAGEASEKIAIWCVVGIATILVVMIAPVVWSWIANHWASLLFTGLMIGIFLAKATWEWK